MKKFTPNRAMSLTFVIALFSIQVFSQNIWFNEFHYDNASTDIGEFIEIVLQDPGTYPPANFTVTLYNGSNGLQYDSYTLDQFNATYTEGAFTFFVYNFPSNGIQNGSPDGFSIDYLGTVIQFLSYEGTFAAVNGPAASLFSTDIGVTETGSTPAGYSLQLTGTGSSYADFTWAGPMLETKGIANTNQTLVQPPPVTPLSDWAVVIGVLLIGLFAFYRIRRNA